MTDEELRAALETIVADVNALPEVMREADDEHRVLVPMSVVRASLARLP